jgi:signal transduction histidine kinase
MIARMLADDRSEILSRFVERVRDLHGAATQGVVLILDGLPGFLDRLAKHLASAEAPELDGNVDNLDGSAEAHGEQRFDIGIDIVTMAREWAVLRDVLLELLIERGTPPTLTQYRVLSRHISNASLASTARYVDLSDTARRRLAAEHIGFVVHDLRNQVQGASVALELLQSDDSQRGVALECLADSVHGLSRVLDRELSSSRLEALRDVTAITTEELSPGALVGGVLREARPLALARGVRFVVTNSGSSVVKGDARLLHSALANLVGNAVKFTQAGTTIEIRIHDELGQCAIDISDHCGGLDSAHKDDLFTAHVRSPGPAGGYGLGLAIARQAVELHHGVIEVADVPGVGCRFRVTLPASEPALSSKPVAVTPAVTGGRWPMEPARPR